MNRGSIIKRGNYYYWKYKNITGKYICNVIKDAEGNSVRDRQRAMALVERYRAEIQEADQLKSKVEYLTKVAEIKKVINSCKVKIADLSTAYFDHPARTEVSPRHEQSYQTTINDFQKFIHIHYPEISLINEVTEEVAGSYLINYWKRGISSKTYNGRLDTLRIIFRLFLKEDNPFKEFPKKPIQLESRSPFSIEELTRIWHKLNDDTYHMLHKDEMRLLYLLALNTGIRCGDLCLLKTEAINMSTRTIQITPSKTKNSSHIQLSIPINSTLFEHLKEWDLSGEFLLKKVSLRYLQNRDGIFSDTIKLIEASGIKTKEIPKTRRQRSVVKKSFHSFRHTFATLMIDRGVSQIAVSKLLGHSTLQMTNRYVHMSNQQQQNAVENLSCIYQQQQNNQVEFNNMITKLSLSEELQQWLKVHLTTEQKDNFIETFI